MESNNNKPFLSFLDGRPISRISGGEYDGEIIYIQDPQTKKAGCLSCEGKKKQCKEGCGKCGKKCIDKREVPYDDLAYLFENFFKHLKGRVTYDQINNILEHILNDKEPEDSKLKNLYVQAKDIIDGSKGKEIILQDGEITQIPNPDTRECCYICGQSGAGKSTYCANYVREFQKVFPKKKIYLFSRVDKDEVLDKLNLNRIKLDETIIDDPIHPTELTDSLCIFDDVDTIPDKKLRTAVMNLIDDLLEIGRHEGIYVVRISHLINNYKETRKILNECTSITLFPGGSSSYAIKYVLKVYFGFDKQATEKIMRLPSRWVTIYKNFPTCVIYSKGSYLVN